MEKIDFKKKLGSILKQSGFEYIQKAYFYRNNQLIVVISTQKSNFDNSLYLNYGFYLRELNTDENYPKDILCDVRGRFGFNINGQTVYEFNLENGTSQILEDAIMEGLNKIIFPVIKEGIYKYYEIFPNAIATATLKIKRYLNLV